MEVKEFDIFKSIVEKINDIVIVFDENGIILLSNDFANNIKSENLKGSNIFDLMHIPKKSHYSYLELTTKIKGSDDMIMDIQYTVFSLFDETRDKYFNVFLGKDITQQESQKNQLQELIDQKEKFILDLHHKIKNNLQIIYSLLEVQMYHEEKKLDRSIECDNRVYQKLREVVIDVQKRIIAISTVHSMLNKNNYNSQGTFIDLSDYIFDMINNTSNVYSFNKKDMKVNFEGIEYLIDVDKCLSLGLIINELISNFYKFCIKNVVMDQNVNIYVRDILKNKKKIKIEIDISYKSENDVQYELPLESENLINGLISQINSEYNIKKSKNKLVYNITYMNKNDR